MQYTAGMGTALFDPPQKLVEAVTRFSLLQNIIFRLGRISDEPNVVQVPHSPDAGAFDELVGDQDGEEEKRLSDIVGQL